MTGSAAAVSASAADFATAGDMPDNLQCVLDLVHLSRQTLGDRALETELLELFERQAGNALARLKGFAEARGPAGADIAHMLKGSARAVGAFAVANAAADVETAMRANLCPFRPMDDLSRAVTDARRTVAALLA